MGQTAYHKLVTAAFLPSTVLHVGNSMKFAEENLADSRSCVIRKSSDVNLRWSGFGGIHSDHQSLPAIYSDQPAGWLVTSNCGLVKGISETPPKQFRFRNHDKLPRSKCCSKHVGREAMFMSLQHVFFCCRGQVFKNKHLPKKLLGLQETW